MATTTANGIKIEYGTAGDPAHPPLLLVMGLGAQMVAWPEAFVSGLAARGFYVISYDNRDVGLSEKLESGPAPDINKAFAGDHSTASYLLADMADDGIGLLDVLGLESAHIVGASMGGMIVQAMAIRNPERVKSMCSIMSTTGDPSVGGADPEAVAVLLQPPATSREEAMDRAITASRAIGSKGFELDDAEIRARAAQAFDRSNYPVGMTRQLVGVLASPDRTEDLRRVDIPTVVVHGDVDTLVGVSGGEATAAAVPDSKLVVIKGMGHDLPRGVWPTIIDAIADNAARAS